MDLLENCIADGAGIRINELPSVLKIITPFPVSPKGEMIFFVFAPSPTGEGREGGELFPLFRCHLRHDPHEKPDHLVGCPTCNLRKPGFPSLILLYCNLPAVSFYYAEQELFKISGKSGI